MKANSRLSRLFFPLIGLGALIWFIVRVIPKPSRATYPCQRAAFPIASSFVIYLLGMMTSALALNKVKKHWMADHHWAVMGFLVVVIVCGFISFQGDAPNLYGSYQSVSQTPNQPIGVAKGIFPGRVVWVRDSTAVDQQCKNSTGDYWWQDDNTNQTVVDSMVSKALRTLTGKTSDAEAWDAIFRYYNQTHGRGDVGYTAGEKIVIKINLVNGSSGSSYNRADYRLPDTSPQIVYAILDQLVHNAGVAQANIGFGDPGRNVDNVFWNKFHSVFPDVKYWGNGNGRTAIVRSSNPVFMNSDGTMRNYLPTCYLDATYMINIPVLKQHHRAGFTLTSKNHFGTFMPFLSGTASPLHYSLPCTQGDGNVDNGGYGKYRIFVDLIGHKDLGGKTILYLVDGLWSSTNANDPPWKWRMAPFNNSYPASIFASQDPVAIESVGFDFLYNEFYIGNPSGNAFPHYSGVDDFLLQAADSTNWPAGIKYDPEGDGTRLPRSMGVYEHWNNANDKLYSRNLGTGAGIELVSLQLGVRVNAKVFLQGPYSSGSMSTALKSGGYVPVTQPYNTSPWNYTGTEAVASIPSGVVDWVLVELRTGTDASTKAATRAAFLKSDGSVVDTNGTSKVGFEVSAGSYYIVVRHRNHLAIMSASAVALSGSSSLYDFTTAQTQAYGTSAMKDLGGGAFGMCAGDASGNGQVQNDDKNDNWQVQVGTAGYKSADFSLNGQVQNDDKNDYWQFNVGRGTQVP